MSKVIMII